MNERPATNQAAVPDPPRFVPRWFFVRRMQAMFFCGLLCLALGLVLGGALLGMFYYVGGRVLPTVDWRLDREHASATGVITSKGQLTYVHMGTRHPWRVGFEFSTRDGAVVDAVGYTFERSFAAASVGDPVAVEYAPADPWQARPVGGSASLMPMWAVVLVLAATGPQAVVGAALLIYSAARARSERLLLVHGAGAAGEVVRLRRVGYIHFGAQSPFDVYYQFRDHRGLEVADRDRTYHYRWAEALRPGDKVGVVYHRQSPNVSALWLHGTESG